MDSMFRSEDNNYSTHAGIGLGQWRLIYFFFWEKTHKNFDSKWSELSFTSRLKLYLQEETAYVQPLHLWLFGGKNPFESPAQCSATFKCSLKTSCYSLKFGMPSM